jgi:hypothetical protein
VIAIEVSVSQALFQRSRPDWKVLSRSVPPMHNRSSSWHLFQSEPNPENFPGRVLTRTED